MRWNPFAHEARTPRSALEPSTASGGGGGGSAPVQAIEAQSLVKTFDVGDEKLTVLREVSFSVTRGEVVAIIGESGSGKSTLLHLLGTLDRPTSGTLRIGGKDPFEGGDPEVSLFRNRAIGFVFQHNNLLPEFTALENVMIPGLIAGFREADVHKRATDLLTRVGLSRRMKHYPGQMSGGEQQRVATARALINQPVVLLADEPSGNLDSANAANIHSLFLEVNALFGTTVVVVTHNAEFYSRLPRRIELRDGVIRRDTKMDIRAEN